MEAKKPARRHPRLKTYDYSAPGAYFITVCTKDRQPFLAVRRAGCPHPAAAVPPAEPLPAEAVFALTEIGRWTEEAIRRTESAYPGVCILSYVVMPDHWHLLLRLLSPEELAATPETSSRNGGMGASRPTSHDKAASNPERPRRPTVPLIVRAIKQEVTRRAGGPLWQTSFYDHVVRTEQDLQDIEDYIRYNPQSWLEKQTGSASTILTDIQRGNDR